MMKANACFKIISTVLVPDIPLVNIIPIYSSESTSLIKLAANFHEMASHNYYVW